MPQNFLLKCVLLFHLIYFVSVSGDDPIQDLLKGANCPSHGSCSVEKQLSTVNENNICRCDFLCSYYGDCCLDYDIKNVLKSSKAPPVENGNLVLPTCVFNPALHQWYYVVNSCPALHTDAFMKMSCENNGNNYVSDQSGIVYANNACLQCNNENKTFLQLQYILPTRKCVPYKVVNKCSFNDETLWGHKLDELCHKYTSPVVSKLNTNYVYKNIFCAFCNGVPFELLSCFNTNAKSRLIHKNLKLLKAEKPVNYDVGIQMSNSVPAAFSILLNFGLDGKERMMFSSEGAEEMRKHQERCGSGFIWDPFDLSCRQLYCSAQYILVGFTCIRKVNVNQTRKASRTSEDDYAVDATGNSMQVTLRLQAEYKDLKEYGKEYKYDSLPNSVRDSLSSMYKISPERIQNVCLSLPNNTSAESFIDDYPDDMETLGKDEFEIAKNFTIELQLWLDEWERAMGKEFNFDAKFELLQPPDNMIHKEPSTEKVVALMASSVSLGAFDIHISNMRTRVYAIHQNVNAVHKQWCNPMLGGRQVEYWNDEFHLILHDDDEADGYENFVKEVYINKTSRTYKKGDFIANILFQGYSGNDNHINVSGVVFVCEHSTLNETCGRVKLSSEEYSVRPNGSLLYHGKMNPEVLDLSAFETAENNSIYVCYNSEMIGQHWYQYPLKLNFDPVQAVISFVLLCVSLVALGIVLVTYILFGSLRNLPGCNMMNLTLSLFLSQSVFLLGQRQSVGQNKYSCAGAGIILHYFILVSFMWMNIMAYDLYKTFGNKNILAFIRSKKQFLPKYMSYAYGVPLLIVCVSTILNFYEPDSTRFQPDYGFGGYCWMANPLAAFVFFAAPLAVVMLANLCLYCLTIYSISAVQKKITTKTKNQHGRSDAILYIKMAVVVGFTWLFSFIAAWSGNLPRVIGQIFVYLFIIFNTLQGVFIFFAFVFNKRVKNLYAELIRRIFQTRIAVCAQCKKSFCTCVYITGAIKRTDSTDTTSTIAEDVSVK